MNSPSLNDKYDATEDLLEGEESPAVQAPLSFSKVGWSSLLSLLVLGVIGYFTFELEAFRQMLQRLNPWMITAAVAMLVLRVVLGGGRLSYVSQGRLKMMTAIRGQLAWDFFSNVTPSAIGGGPFAAVYISRDSGITLGETTAIMLFAILLDQFWFALMIPVLLAAMPFLNLFPASIGYIGTGAFISLFVGLLLWTTVFGYAVLFRPEILQKLTDLVFRIKWLRRFRHRVAHEMNQLRYHAILLRRQPPSFFVNGFLLTLAGWLSRFLLPMFIVWSVHPELDKVLLLLRTIAMSIGAMVLPTPGGSGGVEGLYALFLGPLMPSALVAPTLLLWRLLGYYLFIALGTYLSMHHVQQSIRRRRMADAPGSHAPVTAVQEPPKAEIADN